MMIKIIQGNKFLFFYFFIFLNYNRKKNDIYHELTDDVQTNLEEALIAIKKFSTKFSTQDEFSNFRIVFVKYLENNLLKEFVLKSVNEKLNLEYNNIVETKRHKILDGKKEVVRNILKIKRKLNTFNNSSSNNNQNFYN